MKYHSQDTSHLYSSFLIIYPTISEIKCKKITNLRFVSKIIHKHPQNMLTLPSDG